MKTARTPTLREAFKAVLAELNTPERVIADHFLDNLRLLGLKTTAADTHRFVAAVTAALESGEDLIRVPLTGERLRKHGITKDQLRDACSLEGVDQAIAERASRIESVAPKAFASAAKRMGKAIARHMISNGGQQLADQKATRESFEAGLAETWGGALDSLEVLICVARELSDEVDLNWRRVQRKRRTERMGLLHFLFARACRTADEVLVLLRSGLASGAHARWRSLHEISVVATIIGRHGDDVAARYLAHDVVSRLKQAKALAKHAVALRLKPPSPEVLALREKERDAAVARFGAGFKANYGWASELLGKDAQTFEQLETLADLALLRPYYGWASQAVHGNTQGTLEAEGSHRAGWPLAGPSDYGLAEPGQLTASSLAGAFRALIAAQTSLDSAPYISVLDALASRTRTLFGRAHQELEGYIRAVESAERQREREPTRKGRDRPKRGS